MVTHPIGPGRRVVLAGAACAVFLSLAACAGTAGHEPDAGPTSDLPPFQLALPFDQYEWTPREQGELEQARSRLAKSCVQSRGTTSTMPERIHSRELPGSYDNSRRYGLVDGAAAARFGYHIPANADTERQRIEIRKWNKAMSAAEEIALYGGRGKTGCYEQVDAQLAAGVPNADTDWLTARSIDSLNETAKKDNVVQATARWRACMATNGFSYAGPFDALGDPRWNLDSPAIPDVELRTAHSDVRCKDSSGLVRVWNEAETLWQQQTIQEYPSRFSALAAAKEAKLVNVRR